MSSQPREATVPELQEMAEKAGLHLTEGDLTALAAGVTRSRRMTARLREIVPLESEPATVFDAEVR